MIVLDSREYGMPAELAKHDVPFAVQKLEFGDCMFEGNGPTGLTTIGCERKKLPDLVNSIRDRRLSGHQLKGMWEQFDIVFLFAEGIWRRSANGDEIEQDFSGFGRWTSYFMGSSHKTVSYRQVQAYLTTLELRGNVIVRRTRNAEETAAQYAALWHWFNDKQWADHSSHEQIYVPEPGRNLRGGKVGYSSQEPSLVYKMAAQLPGIDTVRAKEIAARFTSGEQFMEFCLRAGPKEWEREFKGKGIGKVTAEGAFKAIRKSDSK